MAKNKRNYSLVRGEGEDPIQVGLASAKWYHSEVSRQEMKALMKRKDGPAIRDSIIWLGTMLICAIAMVNFWGGYLFIPFFLVYAVLYGSASDSRWHECGHGTAFKTRWMNRVIYHIASFMIIRNPITWQWSHTRHHSDTVIVGRDPEIALMRPPDLFRVMLNFFGIVDSWNGLKAMIFNALGSLDEEEKSYVPEQFYGKVVNVARIWCLIYLATICAAIYMNSLLPFFIIGLPRLFGAWHHVMTGLLQHGGLAENVIDHRLNSRSVYMNPISRFIYWNMNYHVEHHMFPMIPYHNLPKLHEMIKHDLPPANPSIFAGYKEMWPALKRQLKYEDYFILRELPKTAKPYKAELHELEVQS